MNSVKGWPEWANWRSVDRDGTVTFWDNEPVVRTNYFYDDPTKICAASEQIAEREILNQYQLDNWPSGMLTERPKAKEEDYYGMDLVETKAMKRAKGVKSDGSTASYYELPSNAKELQDLISYRNMNAQDGEIFRAIYRKGLASHSDELRDAKKVLFYAQAEVARLEKLKE